MVTKKNNVPKITIISPSYNTGRFLEETIQSIKRQTFTDYEHIIVDGVSTDKTLSILKKHPEIRSISEKDSGYHDALLKGVKLARGEYIMICMISDGYVNKNWLKICSEKLDSDEEVSLVWGFPQWMTEDGILTDISYPHFKNGKVPQKTDWFSYWLATGDTFPNGNFCVRKTVFEACNPTLEETSKGQEFFDFNFTFNRKGYLPWNFPVVADFGREHTDQLSKVWSKQGTYKEKIKNYYGKITSYKEELLKNKKKHTFRDGRGKVLPATVNLKDITQTKALYLRSRILISAILQRGPRKIQALVRSKLPQ